MGGGSTGWSVMESFVTNGLVTLIILIFLSNKGIAKAVSFHLLIAVANAMHNHVKVKLS